MEIEPAPKPNSAPIIRQVPPAMLAAKRWLLHRKKVPYYINGARRAGELDGELDLDNLACFDAATATLEHGAFDGLGFALGCGWQGIDLDDVEANGLHDIANSLPGYVEYSPSGRGCHAIGYGGSFQALKTKGVEAYSAGRYFTFTGNFIGGELSDLAPFVNEKLEPLRSQSLQNQPRAAESLNGSTDTEIISLLQSNPSYSALYEGDTSGQVGRSETDMAFCNVLALWGVP